MGRRLEISRFCKSIQICRQNNCITASRTDALLTRDSEILSGTPLFVETRVPIKNLFDYLESEEAIVCFLDDFGGVKRKQVLGVPEMSQKFIESPTSIWHGNLL